MSLKSFSRIILIILTISSVNNCILLSFGDLDDHTIPATKIKKNTDHSLTLMLHYELRMNGEYKDKFVEKKRMERIKLCLDAYRNSGIFHSVSDDEGGDIIANVFISENSEANLGFALLSGATLFLFPSIGTADFSMHTVFATKTGKPLGTIQANGWQLVIMQILMLFPMIIWNPYSEDENFIIKMNQFTINEAIKSGIFNIK
ncbi:hypothetical protein CH371_18340 [Leptospira wolffii]|uniref:Uncharacterized protein n=1 Tax=Leptospira wolffii TaxID=409998 RepID=A0A2M9Z7J9_9LEPT|nr:hypothetical protein [Leptospira wolffii]PJZ64378.1 hypothetical protein CH371_18340 [Leptospira wolffii]